MEIKFRAWDNKKQEWLLGYKYESLGGFSLFGECVIFGEWASVVDKFMFDRADYKFSDLIVMQFIGLKCVDNTELYSGDILQEVSRPKNMYVIFEVPGGFAINIHQSDFGKETQFYESTANRQTADFIQNSCKKIGNIYDNKDLLK